MASTIWGTFELLRGRYQRHQYGQVILPFVVLRRLDCVLEPTKAAVLKAIKDHPDDETGLYAQKAAKQSFWNSSKYAFETLGEDTANLRKNLINYVEGFSENIQDVFIHYKIEETINELNRHGILLQVFQKFAAIDLHPEVFSNHDMADLFEKLISMDAESANLEAGEYFTPRDVIRLMIDLLITPDADILTKDGVIRTVYDPTAGTGGMLSLAEEHILRLNPKAKISVFGQELNERTYSICKADMIVKGQDVDNIRQGDTLKDDHFRDKKFDYCLANPPYGVEWKVSKDAVEEEARRGFAGRFGAGLPRISDGQLLFVQHMVHHMKPVKADGTGGGRVAVVFNGSPLFAGGAGSGESEIRGWLLKNDLLEAIIALPEDMFFNTEISTYIWILSNRKSQCRKGKVQLINAAHLYEKMRKSLGCKRNEILPEHAQKIARIYAAFKEEELCKIFRNEDFAYREVTIERPLRLNYSADAPRLERLRGCRLLSKLSSKEADSLAGAILSEVGTKKINKRAILVALIEKALKKSEVRLRISVAPKIADELAEVDPAGEIVLENGKPVPDKELRDTEIISGADDIQAYFELEVKPHVPDAWISDELPLSGYEIPFTRHFYKYQPPRGLKEIDEDIRKLAQEIKNLLEDPVAQAATKSASPRIAMRDSGVPWIGKVPAHWQVKRLKRSFCEVRDKSIPGDEQLAATQKYGVISQSQFMKLEDQRLVLAAKGTESFKHVNRDDFVISLRAFEGGIERSVQAGCVSPAYTVLRSTGDLLPDYAARLLKTKAFISQISAMYDGLRDGKAIKFKDAGPVFLPIPPKSEQQVLVTLVSKIDLSIAAQERMVELMKERRAAIIAQAVTGQIDVR